MFTGIVEELGEVVATEPGSGPGITRLTVRGPLVSSDAAEGDSIAVNGVCLTVTGVDGDLFSVDVVAETLGRTSIGGARRVNLERAVTPATRLGGHLVQGHVDGVGALLERGADGVIRVGLPPELSRYLVEKGSITVDGISLTVVSVDADSFTIALIPTTLARTTLGQQPIGGPVNLEVDVVAKYVERLLGARAGTVGA
jgi:riboflavin synthase